VHWRDRRTREIKLPIGERTLRFKGLEFLQRWAIPNALVHVVTAYDILRHNGVDLGKSATFSTVAATGRHMTNGGTACRLLRTEREGNHGADARALPL
jgi:hypothetical protein